MWPRGDLAGVSVPTLRTSQAAPPSRKQKPRGSARVPGHHVSQATGWSRPRWSLFWVRAEGAGVASWAQTVAAQAVRTSGLLWPGLDSVSPAGAWGQPWPGGVPYPGGHQLSWRFCPLSSGRRGRRAEGSCGRTRRQEFPFWGFCALRDCSCDQVRGLSRVPSTPMTPVLGGGPGKPRGGAEGEGPACPPSLAPGSREAGRVTGVWGGLLGGAGRAQAWHPLWGGLPCARHPPCPLPLPPAPALPRGMFSCVVLRVEVLLGSRSQTARGSS